MVLVTGAEIGKIYTNSQGVLWGLIPDDCDSIVQFYTDEFFKRNQDLRSESVCEILSVYTTGLSDTFIEYAEHKGYLKTHKSGGGQYIAEGGVKKPKRIANHAIAEMCLRKYIFANVNFCNKNRPSYEDCDLCVYAEDGDQMGTYQTSPTYIRNIIRTFKPSANEKDFKEIVGYLEDHAPIVSRTGLKPGEEDLIPLNNCIFDFKNKVVLEFSPEYVFNWKARINYNPTAQKKVFTRANGVKWDFDSWLLDLMSGVQEDADAMLDTIHFILRPFTANHKSMFFFSRNIGNTGKTTWGEVLKNIIGDDSVENVTLDNISKEFLLTNIPNKCMVLGDDNDYRQFIDASQLFKILCTNGSTQINRKFRDPLNCTPYVSMVEMMNSLPRFRDHSDANYRRIWCMEFKRSFVEGSTEDKDIKGKFLVDADVLEYILYEALMRPWTRELPMTQNVTESVNEIMELNDPLRDFIEEVVNPMAEETGWERYPLRALWLMYDKWAKNRGVTNKVGKNTFNTELIGSLKNNEYWEIDSQRTFTITDTMLNEFVINPSGSDKLVFGVIKYNNIDDFRDDDGVYYNLPLNKTAKTRSEFSAEKSKPKFVRNYKGFIQRKRNATA